MSFGLPMRTVLAGSDDFGPLQALREGFLNETAQTQLTVTLACAALLAATVAAVVRIASEKRRARLALRASYLRRATELLGLDRHTCGDLVCLAERAKLPCPAAMLLSPQNLAYAVNLARRCRPDPELEQRLDRLCRELFGTPLPDKPSATASQNAQAAGRVPGQQ